jgi:hypothetical protein
LFLLNFIKSYFLNYLKTMSMKNVKLFLLAAFLLVLNVQTNAQLVSVRLNLPTPPPPRACASRPPCPSPDYIWRDGRWYWDDYVRDYVWTAGYWEYAPQRRYQEPYYEQRGHGHGRGHERRERRGRDRD